MRGDDGSSRHVPYNAAMENIKTIFDWLVKSFPEAKKTTLREMIAGKRVRINGAVALSLKQAVTEKDKVEVTDMGAAPARSVILGEGLKLVHMDADIIIVDKPTGLLTATDAKEQRPTVLKMLTNYYRDKNSKNQI